MALIGRLSPQPNVLTASNAGFSRAFWPLLLVTGALTGLAGGLLMALLHAVQHVAFSYSRGVFLPAVIASTDRRRVLVVLGAGLLAGVVAYLLKLEKTGTGGDLNTAIWFRAGQLDPLRTGVRAVLAIVLVALGASLGREGAPKQAGGLIASLLGGWRHLPDPERRLIVACGAGAGMAAVYNVPLGGALFALEVLLGTLSLPLVMPALACAIVATMVSWLLLPTGPTYTVPFHTVSPGLIVWSLLAGPIAGVASVGFTRLICWADTRTREGWVVIAAPMGVFLFLGISAIWFPQLLGNGKDVVQLALLSKISLPLLCALLLLKPLATASCLASGAPGGLFTPALTYGALLGGLLGHVWSWAWPGVTAGSYALVGAGAVLAGTTLGPISAIVLVLELTHRLDALLVPMILAVTGAVLVARALDPRSIYSGRIQLGRQKAAEAAADAEPPLFAAARAPEMLARLLSRRATAPLAVVNEKGEPIGAIDVADHDDIAHKLGTASAIVIAADLARAGD